MNKKTTCLHEVNCPDCLKEIARLRGEAERLTKERDFFKKTLAINHLLDQKGSEILAKMVLTASKTYCADCGKPSSDHHNCPEQARANQKAQREKTDG